jgi:hypothetical protein
MRLSTAVITTDVPDRPLAIRSQMDLARAAPHKYSRYAVNGIMLLGAALVAGSGAIHLHLWLSGYRDIHTIGPLLLAQAISAFVIAFSVMVSRRTACALAGIALLAGTAGGLLFSSWHGIFGFHDSLNAPFAGVSLFGEGAGIAVLAAAGVGRTLLKQANKPGSPIRRGQNGRGS